MSCSDGDAGCWIVGEENKLTATAETVASAARLEKVPAGVDMETKH